MRLGEMWRRCLLAAVGLSSLALPGCHHSRRPAVDNEVLFQQAQNQIERRKFYRAIQTLGDMGITAPVSEDLEAQKSLALADAYFYQGGAVSAIEAQTRYEQYLAFHPLDPRAPYARYMVGVCLLEQAESPENDQEYSRKALNHFQAMARDLPPDNAWGRAARIMLVRAQNRLAGHEWAVAQYYVAHKRWPAAIGRLSAMIDDYPGYRQRGQALYQLASAQKAVGDVPSSRLTLERLLAEFPTGALADQARGLEKALAAAESAPAKTGASGGSGGASKPKTGSPGASGGAGLRPPAAAGPFSGYNSGSSRRAR